MQTKKNTLGIKNEIKSSMRVKTRTQSFNNLARVKAENVVHLTHGLGEKEGVNKSVNSTKNPGAR